jgi:hypothetical protein
MFLVRVLFWFVGYKRLNIFLVWLNACTDVPYVYEMYTKIFLTPYCRQYMYSLPGNQIRPQASASGNFGLADKLNLANAGPSPTPTTARVTLPRRQSTQSLGAKHMLCVNLTPVHV